MGYDSSDDAAVYRLTDELALIQTVDFFPYCIKDASEGYFGKEPEDLTDYESTLLAGVPNAPSKYAPTVNLELAEKRQEQVVERLVACGLFTKERALETLAGSEKKG